MVECPSDVGGSCIVTLFLMVWEGGGGVKQVAYNLAKFKLYSVASTYREHKGAHFLVDVLDC